MRNTWRQTFRRLAAGCIICGSSAWSSAVCYAITLAQDSASDPTYASGWADNQNGGSGFRPWDFENTLLWPNNFIDPYSQRYVYSGFTQTIDNGSQSGTQFSNPNNGVGRSWVMAQGPEPGGSNLRPVRAGRGFPALQVGQTLSIVVDNPKMLPPSNGGSFIKFNGRSASLGLNNDAGEFHGNLCYGDKPCYLVPKTGPGPGGPWKKGADPITQLAITDPDFRVWGFPGAQYMYGSKWQVSDAAGLTFTGTCGSPNGTGLCAPANGLPVTSASGMKIDLTITGTNTYQLEISVPDDASSPVFTRSGTLINANIPIDWVQFDHLGSVTSETSDFTQGTDFYIRSLTISDATPDGPMGDLNGDTKVDILDYVYWRANGLPAGDYDLWRGNYGEPNGSGSGTSSVVPEPGTFVYLVGAVGGLMGLAKRRRS